MVEIKLDTLLIYILPRQILNDVNLLIVHVKVINTCVLYLCCRLYNRDQEITLDQAKNLVTTDTQTYLSICMQFNNVINIGPQKFLNIIINSVRYERKAATSPNTVKNICKLKNFFAKI